MDLKLQQGPAPGRPHFELLDGMRGVAALCVVVFHFMEIAIADYSNNFIGHGFLAVDFFFCLSGFVIGYAYDNRIEKIGVLNFFKARLIRLHPLVVLGSVLGLLGFLLDPLAGAALYGAGKIALVFLCSALVIPCPVMAGRWFNNFSFNAPAWSLFWEYVANIVYAFLLWRIRRPFLLALIVVSAVVLFFVGYRAGNMMGGWSGGTFWDGGARVAFSFMAGLLVYRFNWRIKTRLSFGALSILLVLAFVFPFGKWNWLTEPVIVFLYFPFLIALGAGATPGPQSKKLCILAGSLSYPLYMSHYWAMWLFAEYFGIHHPAGMQLFLIVSVGAICLVGLAWVVMRLYDIPVRAWLRIKS
jgi:peptidoglycan/LPS O-acetylase OafA/YrhL